MKAKTVVERLEKFKSTWIANPAAMLEFADLVAAVLETPRHDHADHDLLEWIDEERRAARSLGIKR